MPNPKESNSWWPLGATGKEALPPLQEAGIDCAMITLNGAQVFDKSGTSLFTVPISKEKPVH